MRCLAMLLLMSAWVGLPAFGDSVSRVGQVVCSQCWFEADRSRVAYGTAGDLDCASRCAARGVPPALAVRGDDGFALLHLEGSAGPAADTWLDLTGKFVRVSGQAIDVDGKPALRAVETSLLDGSPWPAAPPPDPDAVSDRLEWTDLAGHTFSAASLHGRIVVLNFWATWCAPCIEEMPDLVRLQNHYGMYGVQVVGAAADHAGRRTEVLDFARKLNINFPVVLGASIAQMESLGAGVALPATVVLDRHGHPVHRVRGVVKAAELEKIVAALVEGKEVPPGDLHAHAGHRHGTAAGHRHGGKAGTHASLVPS